MKMKKLVLFILIMSLIYCIANMSAELCNLSKDKKVYSEISKFKDQQTIRYTNCDDEILSEYKKLYEENNDLIGWIKIPNTKLDYPVMHTPNNKEYYLRKNFYKEYSISGTPFLSEECSINPDSDNIIIYAHHMNNGTMFTSILNFKDKDYYEKNKIVEFDTLYEKREYEVVYSFYIDVTAENGHFDFYNFINFGNENIYDAFINGCKENTLYDVGYSVDYNDNFLTLVTCSYHSENGRFVIICKKI